MHVGGCSLLITVLAWSFTMLCAETPSSIARKKRHMFPLLGFLEGYKMGQNFALQLPPFVLTPVMVFPSLNQQQNENGSFQMISPQKLVQKSYCNSTGMIQNSDIKDIEKVKVIQENNELLGDEEASLEKDMFRQNNIATNNSVTDVDEKEKKILTSTEVIDTTFTESENITNAPTPYGPYPTAIYKFDNISMLTITEAPIDSDLILPSIENHWQNFTTKDKSVTTEVKVERRAGEVWRNGVTLPAQYVYTRYQNPAPYYYHHNADRIKQTEWNYERPAYEAPNRDRWNTYYSSGNNQLTSEFRPLAGLYYDGFLHKSPVKKTGFVPNNNYYY